MFAPYRTAIPSSRNYKGQAGGTFADVCARELALGSHSRSGGQFDVWNAVFGPVGADGFPAPVFDKVVALQ